MQTTNDIINEAFRLCSLYRKRYHKYPTKIGVHSMFRELEASECAISLAQNAPQIPFVVIDEIKQPENLYLYNEDSKAVTSALLDHSTSVPLWMLPHAIQQHYKDKLEALGQHYMLHQCDYSVLRSVEDGVTRYRDARLPVDSEPIVMCPMCGDRVDDESVRESEVVV